MEVRPLDDILSSLCYLSDHIGFYGTIKNCASDFVVTEIDVTGQLVTEQTKKGTEEIQSNGSNDNPRKKQKIGPGATDLKHVSDCVRDVPESCSEKLDDVTHDHNPLECEADLCNILSPLSLEVQKSLNDFACSVKASFESPVSGNNLSELSLGLYPEKHTRAIIHSAVRQTFPHLLTFTRKAELLVKPNLDYQELSKLTSEEETEEFFKFLDAKVEKSRFTFQPDVCKEHRTSVHHFISKKFGKLVESKSFTEQSNDGPQNISITVRFREKKDSCGKRNRTEENADIFTAFTLKKENLETLEAISYLSSLLGVLPSDFSYAGIKDKKAITYQSMVVKKVTPQRLLAIESLLEKKGINIYNVHPASQHIHLGQLTGNRFMIILRDVRNHIGDVSGDLQKRVEEAIDNVMNKGFINYYGPQRFGKGQNMQSHEIGLALLKEEMEIATKLLFTPEDSDDPVNKAKKHFFQTEDAKGALALMPSYKVRERMVLRALNRYGLSDEGYERSWLSIPHSMRIFYIHAFCSKVWNKAASYRICTYGSKVVEGDLVLLNDDPNEKSSLGDRVRIVTAEEEKEEVFSIHQVVLPMPGHSIKYPTNQVGQWYKEDLASAGLEFCKFRVGPLQLNIPGCYRYILKYPYDLLYELNIGRDDRSQKVENRTNSEDDQALKTSLNISFQLDSSCYATVCLREVMKCNF